MACIEVACNMYRDLTHSVAILKQGIMRTGLQYWQKRNDREKRRRRGERRDRQTEEGAKVYSYWPAEEMGSVTQEIEFSCFRMKPLFQELGGKGAATMIDQLDLLYMIKC